MIIHDGFGHETSHSCPHGKPPGAYCEPCNSSAIESGVPINMPKDKCPYCGNPIETPVQRRIISRPPRGTMTFCSEACGGYYQMGCEG
jgi:hypothetical protein